MAINVGDLVANLRLDMAGFAKGVNRAQRKMDDLGSRMKSTGASVTSAGKSMTAGVTAPLVGMGVAAFKTSADFQGAMNKVKAVMGDAADDDSLAKLRAQAQELGSETVFSAQEAADGMSFLAMAGFDAQQTMEALPSTLDLAAAGSLELGQAADIASNVMSGMGMKADEVSQISDVLAKTASSANTSVEQMGNAMSFVAPVASSAGMSLEETAAVIGQLGNAGIQGSRAGTTLRGALAKLLSPSGKGEKALNRLGIAVKDSSGEMLPFIEIMRNVEASGADTADMIDIFGRRAGPGMAALLTQGLGSLDDLTGTLGGAEGAAGQMADTMMEGAAGAMARFKAAAEAVMIAIGDSGLLDTMTQIIERIAAFAKRLSEANPRLFKIGVIVAAVVAAIGPLLMIVGLTISAIGSLATVLGAVTLPMIAIPAAIAAVVAALIYLWNTNEGFRNAVKRVWTAIKNAVTIAVAALRQVISKFVAWAKSWWATWGDDIMATARKTWEQIQSIIESVTDVIEAVIEMALNAIEAFWRSWGSTILAVGRRIFDVLQNVVENVWNGIKNIISGVLNTVQGIFETFAGLFTGDWSRMWEGVKQIFNGLWQTIVGLWQGGVNSVVDIFHGLIASVGRIAGDIVSRLTTAIGEAIGQMVQIGRDIVGGLIDGITDMAGDAMSAARDLAGDVAGAVGDFIGWGSPAKLFIEMGRDSMIGMAKGIKANATRATREAVRAASKVQSGFNVDAPSIPVSAGMRGMGTETSTIGEETRQGDTNINVDVRTDADAWEIADEIGWVLE